MEHVPEKQGTFVLWLQKVLSRTGIWPSLFGDCRLDADCTSEIKKIGFKEISWLSVTLDGYVTHPFLLILSRQHIFGIATK